MTTVRELILTAQAAFAKYEETSPFAKMLKGVAGSILPPVDFVKTGVGSIQSGVSEASVLDQPVAKDELELKKAVSFAMVLIASYKSLYQDKKSYSHWWTRKNPLLNIIDAQFKNVVSGITTEDSSVANYLLYFKDLAKFEVSQQGKKSEDPKISSSSKTHEVTQPIIKFFDEFHQIEGEYKNQKETIRLLNKALKEAKRLLKSNSPKILSGWSTVEKAAHKKALSLIDDMSADVAKLFAELQDKLFKTTAENILVQFKGEFSQEVSKAYKKDHGFFRRSKQTAVTDYLEAFNSTTISALLNSIKIEADTDTLRISDDSSVGSSASIPSGDAELASSTEGIESAVAPVLDTLTFEFAKKANDYIERAEKSCKKLYLDGIHPMLHSVETFYTRKSADDACKDPCLATYKFINRMSTPITPEIKSYFKFKILIKHVSETFLSKKYMESNLQSYSKVNALLKEIKGNLISIAGESGQVSVIKICEPKGRELSRGDLISRSRRSESPVSGGSQISARESSGRSYSTSRSSSPVSSASPDSAASPTALRMEGRSSYRGSGRRSVSPPSSSSSSMFSADVPRTGSFTTTHGQGKGGKVRKPVLLKM